MSVATKFEGFLNNVQKTMLKKTADLVEEGTPN